MANLTVAKRWANRLKGNDTPFEAFGGDQHTAQGIVWEEILQRAKNLPDNKSWRFGPNSMERYESEGGFIARQLTDTAYMARVAGRYLGALQGVEQVLLNPGRLTALVRGKWHLNDILSDHNRKTREDHRHHAIDAAVIALTDRAVLSEVSRLTARGADDRVHLAVPDLDEGLAAAIRERVRTITVAYKPDHGLQGRMYNDTAYGLIDEDRRDPNLPEHGLVTRKALANLTPKECESIRDPQLRKEVLDWLYEATAVDQKHEHALAKFAGEHGIGRVRILVTNQTVAPVHSAPYKGYAPESYACCDVWQMPKGRPGKWKQGQYQWRGVFWSYAETIQGSPDKAAKKPHPAAKFVTRLFKDDLVSIGEDGATKIFRIGGFSTTNNKLDVQDPYSTENPQNYVSINVLGQKQLRRLHVTPDGLILSDKRGKAS
jgi:CRISPR-associated endonuclease Csn1